jgi:uncharacterized membrane protein
MKNPLESVAGTITAGVVLALVLIGLGNCETLPIFDAIARWGHFLAGITWIGILYYFNFIQVPFLKTASPETKAELFKEGGLVRNALWWFRWGAMFTLIFGLMLYMQIAGNATWDIRLGALLAIIMWFNVWFIIWPKQKIVVGIVEGASAEEKAAAGRVALLASRTNTLLSIPMLFFMASSAHFPIFG